MISEKETIRISKFLSLVLRHKPEEIGIELDNNGWTDVSTLIRTVNQKGILLNIDILKHVVDTNPKKRFAFDDTFEKIRANQGHSVEVELGYEAKQPPAILYHGTGEKYVNQILQSGLDKRSRHHVHLTSDFDTAIKVGQRHGKPVVFEVMAAQMFNEKMDFYLSDNGVWLTDIVPSRFLKIVTDI